jgi:hypothetical protein
MSLLELLDERGKESEQLAKSQVGHVRDVRGTHDRAWVVVTLLYPLSRHSPSAGITPRLTPCTIRLQELAPVLGSGDLSPF